MKNNINVWILLIFIVIGALLGSVLGTIVKSDIMRATQTVGLAPTTLDLSVLKINFGFQITLNLASVIGIFFSLFFYKKFI